MELTPQEEEFAARQLAARASQSADEEAGQYLPPRRPWQRVVSWAGALAVLPVAIAGMVLYSAYRLEALFGWQNIQGLSADTELQELIRANSQQQYDMLREALDLYGSRTYIIAGALTVSAIIVSLGFIADIVIDKRRERRAEQRMAD